MKMTSWENKSFEGNPFSFCDSSSYITSKGEKVRSKTECLIADILHNEFAVPYRYEYPLTLLEPGDFSHSELSNFSQLGIK